MKTESDLRFEILSLIEDKQTKKELNELLKEYKKVVEKETLEPIIKQINITLM